MKKFEMEGMHIEPVFAGEPLPDLNEPQPVDPDGYVDPDGRPFPHQAPLEVAVELDVQSELDASMHTVPELTRDVRQDEG